MRITLSYLGHSDVVGMIGLKLCTISIQDVQIFLFLQKWLWKKTEVSLIVDVDGKYIINLTNASSLPKFCSLNIAGVTTFLPSCGKYIWLRRSRCSGLAWRRVPSGSLKKIEWLEFSDPAFCSRSGFSELKWYRHRGWSLNPHHAVLLTNPDHFPGNMTVTIVFEVDVKP